MTDYEFIIDLLNANLPIVLVAVGIAAWLTRKFEPEIRKKIHETEEGPYGLKFQKKPIDEKTKEMAKELHEEKAAFWFHKYLEAHVNDDVYPFLLALQKPDVFPVPNWLTGKHRLEHVGEIRHLADLGLIEYDDEFIKQWNLQGDEDLTRKQETNIKTWKLTTAGELFLANWMKSKDD